MRKYTDDEIVKMYSEMLLGRVYQEKMLERLADDRMTTGFYHLSIGTESLSIGILDAMKPCDYVVPNHRQQTLLVNLLDIKKFTAELLGRATGYCHGKSFEFHIGSSEKHMLPNGALLGSGAPYSVGAALALKLDGKEGVVITCAGEGTTSEGNVHESMNLASVLKAPVVFVVENNGWAISHPASRQFAVENLSVRAAGYGMYGVTVDGHDVFAVREAMEDAIALARKGEPNMVELKTIRHRGHFEGDPEKYRDDLDEVSESLKNDCIKQVKTMILEKGIRSEAELSEIRTQRQNEVDEAFNHADAQPWPDEALTLDLCDVYANVPGGVK